MLIIFCYKYFYSLQSYTKSAMNYVSPFFSLTCSYSHSDRKLPEEDKEKFKYFINCCGNLLYTCKDKNAAKYIQKNVYPLARNKNSFKKRTKKLYITKIYFLNKSCGYNLGK